MPAAQLRRQASVSSYDGDLSLPLGLALGSPIFPSGCEGKLGVALESLQGPRILEWVAYPFSRGSSQPRN